jgi:hypothetical protein
VEGVSFANPLDSNFNPHLLRVSLTHFWAARRVGSVLKGSSGGVPGSRRDLSGVTSPLDLCA